MTEPIIYCSFCGKSQHEVHRLITRLPVAICDECAVLCIQISINPGPPPSDAAQGMALSEDAVAAEGEACQPDPEGDAPR